MQKLFVNKETALVAQEKGFNELCIVVLDSLGIYKSNLLNLEDGGITYQNKISNGLPIPTPQQLIDWLEKKHNIHVSRIWYNDGVTPTRWVYHIDGDYVGSDFDEALIQALNRIK